MVFVTKAFFFHRAGIFGVCTNSNLNPSRCLLSVKLIGLVHYIPIGAVSSLVLYIDQGGVLINSQRKVALHVCFGPTQSLFRPPAVNAVANSTGYYKSRQDDPIASS